MKKLKTLILPVVTVEVKNHIDLITSTDEELIRQINATNSTVLYGNIYDRYSRKIYNKCFSFTSNKQEAEDLTQDVFIKLFIKIHKFKGQSKFSTWLYSFTYNFCVNYVNRDKSRKMNYASDSMDDHDYYLSQMEDVKDEDLFEMDVDVLKCALEKISPEEKSLLLLKYQDDVTVKELQALLKISGSAVKMRLKRARIRVIKEYYNI